jgi:histidyl-tRNA synthetase
MTGRDLKGPLGLASEISQYVIILGPKELKEGKVMLKNLDTGEQQSVPLDTVPDAMG